MAEAMVTKIITFDASHSLCVPEWSREKNIETFHKCCFYKEGEVDQNHGHTYKLEVTVAGNVDYDTGYVIDFKILKKHMVAVTDELDHHYINEHPYFKGKKINPTAENIVQYLGNKLAALINTPQYRVHQLRLWETPDSFATYHGFGTHEWDDIHP